MLILFSGIEIRRSSDEFYPFSPDRNFVYLTGLSCKEAVFLAMKDGGAVSERLYLLPPDMMAERWTGRRITPMEAESASGIEDVRFAETFESDISEVIDISPGSLDSSLCILSSLSRDVLCIEVK